MDELDDEEEGSFTWSHTKYNFPISKNAKKVTPEEWVFVESTLKMQCCIVKNTLLPTAFW